MKIEDAQEKISKVVPHLIVLEYVPAKKGKSLFYDEVRQKEFHYYFFPLIKRFKENPDFIPCPDTTEQAFINNNKVHKIRKSCLARYGVSNPRNIPGVDKKIKDTLLKNYGVDHPSKCVDIQSKKEKRCIEKYGVANISKLKAVQKKRIESFSKYENGHPLKDPKVRKKQIQTGISNGTIRSIDGKTISQWARDLDRHYQTISQKVSKFGKLAITSFGSKFTTIEEATNHLLEEFNTVRGKQLDNTNYRPDFLLPEYNLIIECDGLYWHSDAKQVNRHYHQKKKEVYTSLGYRSFFFREDEIVAKPDIIRSQIFNKLGMSTRLYARRCTIEEIDPKFFEQNHLMGKGSGKCFGLIHDQKVVAGIQVKWINKQTGELDISRFCCVLNTTVVGGFSKLLRAVEKYYKPSSVRTFIDLRYGDGSYLAELGFKHKGTHLSFKWTDGTHTFSRMTFPKNTGYDKDLYKLWDCGQASWIKYTEITDGI